MAVTGRPWRGGGGRGRSGRGRYGQRSNQEGRSQPRTSTSVARATEKTSLSDHIYAIGTDRQSSDFVVTTRFILNLIGRTFAEGGDIQLALQTKKEFDLDAEEPVLEEVSANEILEPKLFKLQTLKCEKQYSARLNEHEKRVKTYRTNKNKAYDVLWKQCAKTLQEKIMTRVDYIRGRVNLTNIILQKPQL
jgi:hypothetical protein